MLGASDRNKQQIAALFEGPMYHQYRIIDLSPLADDSLQSSSLDNLQSHDLLRTSQGITLH